MAYDFLNKTTFTDDLAQQKNMINYLSSHIADQGDADYDKSDDYNVDSDLIQMVANSPDEQQQQEQPQEEVDPRIDTDYDYDDDGVSDNDLALINSMFNNEQAPQEQEQANSSPYTTGYYNTSPQAVDLNWLKLKSNNVKLAGLNQNISKYLTGLPEDVRANLVATSGNDQEHTQGSEHYDNNAIDLRYDDKAYNFIKNDPTAQQMGIKMLNPNHGTAPHIHLQSKQYGGSVKPSKYAFGGSTTLFADTEETLRQGLNDNSYDKAVLKLSGENTIRGLDNNQPVAVTDGSKYKILKGKNDTSTFKGNVYETKLK